MSGVIQTHRRASPADVDPAHTNLPVRPSAQYQATPDTEAAAIFPESLVECQYPGYGIELRYEHARSQSDNHL